jgi:hypothetical protein
MLSITLSKLSTRATDAHLRSYLLFSFLTLRAQFFRVYSRHDVLLAVDLLYN